MSPPGIARQAPAVRGSRRVAAVPLATPRRPFRTTCASECASEGARGAAPRGTGVAGGTIGCAGSRRAGPIGVAQPPARRGAPLVPESGAPRLSRARGSKLAAGPAADPSVADPCSGAPHVCMHA